MSRRLAYLLLFGFTFTSGAADEQATKVRQATPLTEDQLSQPLMLGSQWQTIVGNQPPTLRLRTNPAAQPGSPYPTITGSKPFQVSVNFCQSTDPDAGDSLRYEVSWGDGAETGQGRDGAGTTLEDGGPPTGCDGQDCCRHRHRFENTGTYVLDASVSDKHLEDQLTDLESYALVREKLTVKVGEPEAPSTPAQPALPVFSLSTTFAAGNGQNGSMFDIVSTVPLTIHHFDAVSQSAGSNTWQVYWKLGTSSGFEGNAGAWTLMGSTTTNPTILGVNAVNIGGLALISGQVYGIYVRQTGTLSYSNGSATFSNADLTFTSNAGISGLFAGSFFPRIWNGTIYYTK